MRFLKSGYFPSLKTATVFFVLFNYAALGSHAKASQHVVKDVDTRAKKQSLLTLSQAVSLAIASDPWLTSSEIRERAMLDRSEAVDRLPNAVVSIGLANLPTDGFVFDQEPMTQLKAGVAQQFARGDSLGIQRKQLQELAYQYPLLRQDRMAKTEVMVASLWLEVYRTQQIVALIENDKALFQQLAEIVQASYSSAVGNVRQQDIVRAQLELTRLEDRLNTLMSQKEQAGSQLLEWFNNGNPQPLVAVDFAKYKRVSEEQPVIASLAQSQVALLTRFDQQALAQLLNAHPSILAIEQRIDAGQTGVELAKQAYKPQWGVNASYAYRADDQLGRSRADFFSVGVSFDLPFFTQSSLDKNVSSAVREAEAIKTDKLLALRGLVSQLQSTWSRYQRLRTRQTLFDDNILVQTREQAEASLTSYTNDDGDFAEVVRARIDDLNARIDMLNIEVDLLKAQVELNYYFTTQQSTFNSASVVDSIQYLEKKSKPATAVKVGEY